MKTKSFLVCFIVMIMATSVAMAGGRHGNFGGGFARGGTGSFHGGNWNRHCHGGGSSFVFIGGFPFFGYPYGYYPYGYGYGGGYSGYGPGYYGYGAGYYGNGYYGNRYYGSSYGYNSHQSGVVRLQQQLARAGYYRGSIDGIMGPRTRYALRAYQRHHGTASL
jgi:Putative peptidoglycan binding domain